MKDIAFRPLRRIKKTGKVCVASYMQWRKVKTADYNKFNLKISNDHREMPDDEFVYNHEGEQLFWYNHNNPESLPKNHVDIQSIIARSNCDPREFEGEEWKFTEPSGIGFHWSVDGFDCDGVPVFSHYSSDYLATHYSDMSKFEPLTVGMVKLWFGWFLLQLENSYLQPTP